MINKITRDNYEVFFIDYLDGNLSPAEEEMLQLFLTQNSDLAQELTSLQNIELKPIDTIFQSKNSLKKQESINGISNYFDYLCIAKTEEDITTNEQIELNKLLKNDEQKQSTYSVYQKLKLIPSNALIYKHKTHLKRIKLFNLSYTNIRTFSSVAAALVLFFVVSSLLVPPLFKSETQFAIKSDILPSTVDTESFLPIIEPDLTHVIAEQNNVTAKTNIRTKKTETEIIQESSPYADKNFSRELKSIERVEYKNLAVPTQIPNFKKLSNVVVPNERLLALSGITDEPKEGRSREFGFFELAQLGVKGLSNLTGTNLALDAEKDNSGRISKINFESTLFAVSVPVKSK